MGSGRWSDWWSDEKTGLAKYDTVDFESWDPEVIWKLFRVVLRVLLGSILVEKGSSYALLKRVLKMVCFFNGFVDICFMLWWVIKIYISISTGYRNIFFFYWVKNIYFFCFNGLWREGWVELKLHPSRVKCSLIKWKFPKISKTGFWDCAAWCFLETFEKDITAGTGTRCQYFERLILLG